MAVQTNQQNVSGEITTLTDSTGQPIDADGHLIGEPNRAGNLVILNGQRLVVKQQLIEIVIPLQANPVQQYYFADQPNLRNVATWALEFYTSTSIAISPLSMNPVVSDTMLKYMFLWMQTYKASYNFYQNKPCVTLRTMNAIVAQTNTTADAGILIPFRNYPEGMVGQHINWPNGYVNFSDISIGATNPFKTAAYSICVDVYYSSYDNWQVDGLGSSFGLR